MPQLGGLGAHISQQGSEKAPSPTTYNRRKTK